MADIKVLLGSDYITQPIPWFKLDVDKYRPIYRERGISIPSAAFQGIPYVRIGAINQENRIVVNYPTASSHIYRKGNGLIVDTWPILKLFMDQHPPASTWHLDIAREDKKLIYSNTGDMVLPDIRKTDFGSKHLNTWYIPIPVIDLWAHRPYEDPQ